MTYRKDESKEQTIATLQAKLVDLRRDVRTVENAIDWLEEDNSSSNPDSLELQNAPEGDKNDL